MSSLKRKREDDDLELANSKPTRIAEPSSKVDAGRSPTIASAADILSRLRALLDLTSLTSHADLSARFADIADILLNHVVLRLATSSTSTDFEILELEFYLHKSECHEDPFTHAAEEQRASGKWYFHRAPRRTPAQSASTARAPTAAGGYRGGTRKGLDLTFGSPVISPLPSESTSRFFPKPVSSPAPETPQNAVRGGILLRTLQNRESSKVFSGPSLLVDELLRLSGATNISDLVKSVWMEDTDTFTPPTESEKTAASLRLHVRNVSGMPSKPKKIYRSPRIGLDLSNPGIPLPAGSDTQATLAHPRTYFLPKRYRFFVEPAVLTSNGRGHTLLGVRDDLVQSGTLHEHQLAGRLESITGLKPATVLKYLGEYRTGQKGGLRTFVGAQGKGAGSSPVTFLRMLGCLDTLLATPQKN
ncbi:hypothetical protein PsYK624_160590 [Phanerochaete sordida]|uniref:Uncharacterized protein n=1 Tax=Phanerochaete sordida TaxID=48140 RepID=A0A9P3GRK8_9APHY|nr:hypothetical protein PsYK624_160590 [Phanerochaete sordida]